MAQGWCSCRHSFLNTPTFPARRLVSSLFDDEKFPRVAPEGFVDRKMEKRTPILRWGGEREKLGLHRENPPSSGNFHHLQLPQIKSELFETHVIRSAVMWPTSTYPPCCTCVHSTAALNPFLSHSSPHSFINSISVRRFNFGTCFSMHVPRRGRTAMTKEERMLAGISIATAILT